ncbi:MAG: 50S ribosomal protein L24 [Parcubacteria group bacterium]
MKIKKNDIVKMLAGKDHGKTGKVVKVYPTDEKVVVEGLNLMKKHMRARREGEQGQRVELPRKVTVSDVMLVCPKCSKATRIGYKVSKNKDVKKARVCKKCKGEI